MIMDKQDKNIEPEFMKRPAVNPFRTPEGYFDSLEDRIMGKIQVVETPKKTNKIIRLVKPAIGIAASLLLAFFVINKQSTSISNENDLMANQSAIQGNDSAFNFSQIDESTVINAIFAEEQDLIGKINQDEMLAYLSTGLNEIEIYAEIQNK